MALPREQEQSAPTKRRRSPSRILVHASGAKKAFVNKPAADVTEIVLSKAQYRRFAAKRRFYEKLLANLVDTIEVAEREGRTSLEVSLGGETATVKPAAEAKPLDAAIARAKTRGQTKAADILKGPDMLTARELGPLIGISHETVNVRRQKGEILGLEGPRRGYKYPRWQVTDTGMPLPGLAQLFAVLGNHPWTVYRFLRTAHAELGGRTAVELMKAGRVDDVVGVAKNQAAGAFT